MSLKISPNSTLPPVGNEPALITRNIVRKNTYTLLNTTLGANVAFSSPWQDTQGSGDTVCSLSIFNTVSVNYTIYGCDDPELFAATSTFIIDAASTSSAASVRRSFLIPTRYWRLSFTNGASTNIVAVVVTTSNAGGLFGVNSTTFLPVTIGSNAAIDGVTAVGLQNNAGTTLPLEVCSGYVTSSPATGANYSAARTPVVFRGGQGTANSFTVWNPQTTKKARVMKYAIDIAEDATITSGPLPINIGFRYGLPNSLAATFAGAPATMIDYTHRVVIPANALATSFDGYVSPWVDLGNGVIPTVAGQPLYCGIQVPQTTGAVTPTWTLATTGQWEAGSAAFTTVGGRGAFKLRQYLTQASAVATVASILGGARGTAVFVLIRSTNIAAGAPTNTISDTAGNTWTALTQITNASDGANGSSLQLFYCLNMVGTDANLGANTITNTASVHVPSAQAIIIAEYANLSAIDATAQSTGTGNSTAPAASSFTPTSAGDLILSYAATSTGQATCPTLATAGFFAVAEQGGTAAACLMFGDNWGNGTLATGLVNVQACGTEE